MEGAEAMRDEDDKLDGLIDRALVSYTPQEARPGLEQRILASVAAASRPRPRGWNWRPVWALAGAKIVAASTKAAAVWRSAIIIRPFDLTAAVYARDVVK